MAGGRTSRCVEIAIVAGSLAVGAWSMHVVGASDIPARAQKPPAWTPGTRLHVVAARDSRLFTLCPPRDALTTEASAVRRGMAAVAGRAAILLLTDGVDTRSRLADAQGTDALIGEAHVPVYAIQFDTRHGDYTLPYGIKVNDRTIREMTPVVVPEGGEENAPLFARADAYLASITSSSGGRLYRAENLRDLGEAFRKVAKDLGEQYTLGYYPANQARDGTYRAIRVEVNRPDVQVHTRPGYRAARPGRGL